MTLLLESKLFLPRPRRESVVRPRLLAQLAEGLQHKLILVLAQAGFGKTTLVAHWLDLLANQEDLHHQSRPQSALQTAPQATVSPPCRISWLTLDENDNDPLRFVDYLLAGLQRADSSLGQHARFLLSAPQPPANLEPLVISLINEITQLPDHLVLVLDDYHAITAPAVHEIIRLLISRAPDHLHLVLTSRVEPPLPLTRLRLYRQLLEVREDDLRFTVDEAVSYLLGTMRCSISQADVAALAERTEGWIAGLHLAALSLQRRPDPSTFIADFTGSHAYIVDYLTEEVLQRQPPEVQEFLFQSSLLSRFCGSLCDAVMQRTGSQEVLEYLERSHLFVVALDNERGWYRYHHLFAEMLRRRAQEQNARQRSALYRRATQWYIEQNLVMEAIDYALAAEDGEIAAELIERALPALVARGQFVMLMAWLNRLPPRVLRSHPLLCVTRARTALRQHDLDEAEKWLEITHSALNAQPVQNAEVVGAAHAVGVDLALNRGRVAETIQLARQALEILPHDLTYARGEIFLFMAIAYYWNGQYAEATKANNQAIDNAKRAGDVMSAILAATHQAIYFHVQGQLRPAMKMLEQCLAYATERTVHELPLMCGHYVTWGELLYELNRLEEAEKFIRRGIQLAEEARNPRSLLRGYARLLSVQQAQGRQTEANQSIEVALQLARQYQLPPHHLDECTKAFVRKWLADENMAAVFEWIQRRGISLDEPAIGGLEDEYLLAARFLAQLNKPAAALVVLEEVADAAQSIGNLALALQASAYQAILLQQEGKSQEALTLLTRALEIAGPQGFVRTFVDEGLAMSRLLAALRGRLSPEIQRYVDFLLNTFAPNQQRAATSVQSASPGQGIAKHPAPSQTPDAAIEPLIEPLSERELEVLRLVDQGLSDSKIAKELILATGTIKRHLNNIYGKLGVHTRTQALARAHALGLLR